MVRFSTNTHPNEPRCAIKTVVSTSPAVIYDDNVGDNADDNADDNAAAATRDSPHTSDTRAKKTKDLYDGMSRYSDTAKDESKRGCKRKPSDSRYLDAF